MKFINFLTRNNETTMTKQQFTQVCSEQLTGIYQEAAILAIQLDKNSKAGSIGSWIFVDDLLEQDGDAPSGTEYILGPSLYEALQKFK